MVTQSKSLFESLYREHRPMVYQMCIGFMKGDLDMASDLSQEIFINVWNALSRFKGESSYKTWIYRITVNTCLQQIRRTKTKQNISINENFDAAEPIANTQEAHLQLYKAIGQLPEIDRLIIIMVLEEAEYGEIAKVMGINETNLRVRIHRIKKQLKELLAYAR